MFGFMKKDRDREDKEKKKREKKIKDGKRAKANLTLDELRRLDEARRSLIGKGKKKKDEKLPSGITADYMDQFRSRLEYGVRSPRDSSEFSFQLRSPRSSSDSAFNSSSTFQQLRDHYENLASASHFGSDSSNETFNFRSVASFPVRPPKINVSQGRFSYDSSVVTAEDDEGNVDGSASNELLYENMHPYELNMLLSAHHSESPLKYSMESGPLSSGSSHSLSPLQLREISPSASVSITSALSSPNSLTGLIHGEGDGWHPIKVISDRWSLPQLSLPQPPSPRTLTIPRSPAGDFGFSLRRAQITDRGSGGFVGRRTIVFAEPGTIGKSNVTGLIPGDRLLQVNGISVENRSRDEVIELIKASPDFVKLLVSI